jgi:hypothetical protein
MKSRKPEGEELIGPLGLKRMAVNLNGKTVFPLAYSSAGLRSLL